MPPSISPSGINLSPSLRFAFNGKENDNEVKGTGNQQDYGFRIYDLRLGKFLSLDPLFAKFPFLSPYQFGSLNPIVNIDLDGLEGINAANGEWINKKKGKSAIRITKEEYQAVQQWYKSEGGDGIEPLTDYNYVFTPYKHPDHPNVTGMSPQGEDQYKGDWYREKKNSEVDETTKNSRMKAARNPPSKDASDEEWAEWMRIIDLPEVKIEEFRTDPTQTIEEVDPGATKGGNHDQQHKRDIEIKVKPKVKIEEE